MTPRQEGWKQFFVGAVLFLSVGVAAQAAIGFLVHGCWAAFGGQLFGFTSLGIEPTTGADATRPGVLLILLGLVCALIAFVGIRYSVREINKVWPRRPSN